MTLEIKPKQLRAGVITSISWSPSADLIALTGALSDLRCQMCLGRRYCLTRDLVHGAGVYSDKSIIVCDGMTGDVLR